MRSLKIIILMIIGYLVIFPSSLSAELSEAQLEIIRIAYMNGYTNAVQTDIDTLKILQQDQDKLRMFSQTSVNNYLKKVALLNSEPKRGINEKKSEYKGSNSMQL